MAPLRLLSEASQPDNLAAELHAPVTQWIEYPPSKRTVVGSNPTGRDIIFLPAVRVISSTVEQLPLKQLVDGSNPS